MEEEKKKGKWGIWIVAAVAVLAAGVVCLILFFRKQEESYRSIQIYELQGRATIEREKIGSMDAVENLYLESGDSILVADDSYMRLKLDDDKYILVEENSVLSIVAEGTKENSRTSIDLQQGAITNEIQNPLNQNSSYDVTTPNSVMAVRGTVFRVELSRDEQGETYTKVSTFEGRVGVRRILPDGTMKEENVLVEDGTEVIICMDQVDTIYLAEPQKIDYEVFSVPVLEFLQDVIRHGTDLKGVDKEKFEILCKEKKEEQETDKVKEAQGENGQEGQDEGQSEAEQAFQEEELPEESVRPEAAPSGLPKQPSSPEQVPQQPFTPELLPSMPPEQPVRSEQETEAANASSKKQSGSSKSEGQSGGQSTQAKTYTVTFEYQGAVFGQQSVTEGQQAVVPVLVPSQTGAWDYDFSRPVNSDLTISWKD